MLIHIGLAQSGIQFWNTENGLSNNVISKILQDEQGYIWIATQYGLNRFDGYEFKNYRYEPNQTNSLPANWVRTMDKDSEGKLWLGTDWGGVSVFNSQNGELTSYRLTEKTASNLGNILAILCSKDGAIWVGTGGALFRKNAVDTAFQEIEQGTFKHLQENSKGQVFALTHDTLYLFEPDYEITQQAIFTFPRREIIQIFIDHEDVLWAVKRQQLVKVIVENGDWKQEVVETGNFRNSEFFMDTPIYEDSQHRLWIGGKNDITVLGKDRTLIEKTPNEKLLPKRIHGGNILCFFEDRHQNIWIGTSRGLLMKSPFVEKLKPKLSIPALEKFTGVREIFQTDSLLWLGSYLGLTKLNLAQESQTPEQIIGSTILDIFSNPPYLYAAGKGFHQVHLETGKVKTFDKINGLKGGRIWSTAEDKNGKIWIASMGMLQRFEPITESFEYFLPENIPTLQHAPVLSLLLDSQDRLWSASLVSGLYVLENSSELEKGTMPIFRNFKYEKDNPNSLSNKLVTTLLEDLDGHIWVGTDGGLNRINPTDFSIKRYLQKDGLKDEKIMALSLDNSGQIWGSTVGHGLFRLNPETETFTFFTRKDGLISDNFLLTSAYKNKDGWLFFGTDEQVQIINSDQINNMPKPLTPFTFTDFSCANQRVFVTTISKEKPNIELPHNYQSFTVNYSTLQFYQAEKTEYLYQLKGVHDTWISNKNNRTLTFTGLSPNTYQLNVKAMNPNLAFDEDMITLSISILPPWWKTKIAYLLYVFLCITGIYGLYRFQLQQQVKELKAQRLQELDALKTRFYTNITHEFRTPLTLILGIAKQLRTVSKKDIQHKGEIIQRNGQQLLNLINQILDLSKLEAGKLAIQMEHGDLIPYINYLLESFHSLAAIQNIRLHFLPQIEELWMDYDSEKISQIISNLLANALKYTPEGGDIYFQIDAKNEQAIMTVRDTGTGISTEHLPHIFKRFYQVDDKSGGTGIGLSLTKELLQMMDGCIKIEKSSHQGTTFVLTIPVRKVAYTPLRKEVPEFEKLKPTVSISSHNLPKNEHAPLILIVEDNKDVSDFLVASLNKDYRISTAQNGQLGINDALENVPDLIISDVMMPEKDGFELCQNLKTTQQTSHIPIILLTAKADTTSKIEGLEHGADAYLSKPFEEEELQVRIRKLLELRQILQKRYQNEEFWTQQVTNKEDEFLVQVKTILEKHLSQTGFGIPQLCQKIGISRVHLHRKLKALTNQSTSHFIHRIRLQKARILVKSSDLTISEIAYEVGFADPAYFSRLYSKMYGESPSVTRK